MPPCTRRGPEHNSIGLDVPRVSRRITPEFYAPSHSKSKICLPPARGSRVSSPHSTLAREGGLANLASRPRGRPARGEKPRPRPGPALGWMGFRRSLRRCLRERHLWSLARSAKRRSMHRTSCRRLRLGERQDPVQRIGGPHSEPAHALREQLGGDGEHQPCPRDVPRQDEGQQAAESQAPRAAAAECHGQPHVRCDHACRSHDQQLSPPDIVNNTDAYEDTRKLDNSDAHIGEQRVAEAGRLQDVTRVIEHDVCCACGVRHRAPHRQQDWPEVGTQAAARLSGGGVTLLQERSGIETHQGGGCRRPH
eukprot:7189613-Prymnesium_polylepis.2